MLPKHQKRGENMIRRPPLWTVLLRGVALSCWLTCAAQGQTSPWEGFSPATALVSESTVADAPYDSNQSATLNRLRDGRLIVAWHQGAPTNGNARVFQEAASSFTPVGQTFLLNPNTPSAWKYGHVVF